MGPDRPLRVGIVGFGTMGRKHAASCARIPGVEVVAAVGADEVEASFIRRAGLPAFIDTARMLEEVPLDAIIMAQPPGVREVAILAAAAAGKALFVEKPLALDMATARHYCRAASHVVNAVGFQLRYSPVAERTRQLIRARQITQVRTACTTGYYLRRDVPDWFLQRRHSGGPLLEQAIHMIDMARYLAGEITHVVGRQHRLTHANVAECDSEDNSALLFRFASGALGTHLDSCSMTTFNWEVELFGPDWRLLADFARKRLSGYLGTQTVSEDFPDEDLHLKEMQAFVRAVRTGSRETIRSDFADAARTLSAVLAGDRSSQSGCWEFTETLP